MRVRRVTWFRIGTGVQAGDLRPAWRPGNQEKRTGLRTRSSSLRGDAQSKDRGLEVLQTKLRRGGQDSVNVRVLGTAAAVRDAGAVAVATVPFISGATDVLVVPLFAFGTKRGGCRRGHLARVFKKDLGGCRT